MIRCDYRGDPDMSEQHAVWVLLGALMFHLQALTFVGLAWAGFWLLSQYFCDQLMRRIKKAVR